MEESTTNEIILFKITFNILKTLFASTLIQTNVFQIVQKKTKN